MAALVKTPPGLTCTWCHAGFDGTRPARVTLAGFVHAARCWSLPVLSEAYGHWETRRGIQHWVEDTEAAQDYAATG